jgi:hypothetical protein
MYCIFFLSISLACLSWHLKEGTPNIFQLFKNPDDDDDDGDL